MKVVSPAEYQSRATEAQFQRTVVEAAQYLGWDVFAFPRMIGNPSGFPDLLMLRNGVWRLRELKTERGRLGPKQIEMIARLTANGADVEVWKPDDWESLIVPTLRGEAA